jgi:HAD superfamily hydrolase (TIGR01509 family)
MSRFELVIFDCDGVLIDSESVAMPVLRAMLMELGATLELDELHEQFGGRSLDQVLARAGEVLGEQPPPTFIDDFAVRCGEVFRTELVPIDGVAELLNSLAHPFCTASNADSVELRSNLEVAGLLHHFGERMFSADDVERPKPAPDLYLLAARTLGFEPALCAVVEDTPTGVAAGAAAGMQVFGYASRHPAERLMEAGASETFTAMSELPRLLR